MILESALGPNPFFVFFFGGLLLDLGVCWDRGLDLTQGLTKVRKSSSVHIASSGGREATKLSESVTGNSDS